MTAIIGLILITSVLLVGIAIGRFSAPTSELPRKDRRELEALRDLTSELGAKAAEHAMLGDQFGVIVTAMLNDERRRARGER